MNKETGIHPFPIGCGEDSKGMTMRDYFAAVVLATACEDHGPSSAAEIAYSYADAMLRERNE